MASSNLTSARRPMGSISAAFLLIAAATAVGLAIRMVALQQSPFGDELSTYWIVADHTGLGGVWDIVHTDAEISPPLYFLLAKLTTQIALTPEMLRLPSLLAGVAAIPLTYLLGLRALGRRAGLAAAALVALSPFLIYYSTEARGYQLEIALVLGSAMALLRAVEGDGLRWWIAYAALSSAAMYSHYTAAFVLAGQLLWVFWAHPDARRAALLANLGAALAFLPWLSGLINDLNSPTTEILSALDPFTLHSIIFDLAHWSVGYPYGFVSLGELPGNAALAMLVLGGLTASGWIVWTLFTSRTSTPRADRMLVLVLVLALAAPLGEALSSLISTNLFGTRNLAVAWPGFALLLGSLVTAPARRFVWIGTTGLVVVGFAIGAAKMLESGLQRPDFEAAAGVIDDRASPPDVVIDAMVISPGPLSPLDIQLHRRHRVLRSGVPQESDHPFNPYDTVASPGEVAARAAAASRRGGGRLFVVTSGGGPPNCGPPVNEVVRRLPPRFHQVEKTVFPGICPVATLVFRDSGVVKGAAAAG